MKHLSEYLSKTGLTQTAFAKDVGVSDAYLSQILTGARRPSFDLMEKIEDVTGGQVSINAWRTEAPE